MNSSSSFLYLLGIDLTSSHQTASASTLNFVSCYQGYQCARLEVPLNWSSSAIPSNGNDTAILAIVKLSAQVDPSDERYGGSIITNPGTAVSPAHDGHNYSIVNQVALVSPVCRTYSPEEKKSRKPWTAPVMRPTPASSTSSPLILEAWAIPCPL